MPRAIRSYSLRALSAALLGGCGIHTDYFETRAFEVTVDLTAEGQRMQITQAIECEPWRRREAGLIPYTQWRPKTKSFGRRLPSGAAGMMVTPSFCRSAYRKEGSTSDVLPVSEGHVPYIGWADDADNPTVVEAYISPEYFKRPDARVVYHGMTARIVSASSAAKGANEFGWFENWQNLNDRNIAFGLYAQIIPEETWRKIPDVASFVRNVDTPKLLPLELTFKFDPYANLLWGKDRARRGFGLTPGPSPDRAYDKDGARFESTNIHPLIKIGNTFKIRRDKYGMIAYYRIGRPTLKLTDTRTVLLTVGENIFELPVISDAIRAVYDPNTKSIFLIKSGLSTRFPNLAP